MPLDPQLMSVRLRKPAAWFRGESVDRQVELVNLMVTIPTQVGAVQRLVPPRWKHRIASALKSRVLPRSNGIWPLIGLAMVALLNSAIIGISLTSRMDAQAAAEKRMMMAGALKREVNSYTAIARDNGRWDAAVDHLYGTIDLQWAQFNYAGSYELFVVDRRGAVLYATAKNGWLKGKLPAAMTRRLIAHMPARVEPGVTKAAHAAPVLIGGDLGILAITPILPSNPNYHWPKGDLRYVVVADRIDAHTLASWGDNFGLTGVTWLPAPADGPDDASLAVRGNEGATIGYIRWDAVRPGRAAALALAPVIIVSVLIVALLCAWLSWAIHQSHRALAEEKALAQREAEQRGQQSGEATGHG